MKGIKFKYFEDKDTVETYSPKTPKKKNNKTKTKTLMTGPQMVFLGPTVAPVIEAKKAFSQTREKEAKKAIKISSDEPESANFSPDVGATKVSIFQFL